MDVFPKFIIEEDKEGLFLVIAKCTYHKQLTDNKEAVKGGGWWNNEDNLFTLHGESHDFGKARLEDITNCIKNKRVYSNKYQTHSLCDKFTFQYKNEVGEITLIQ